MGGREEIENILKKNSFRQNQQIVGTKTKENYEKKVNFQTQIMTLNSPMNNCAV